MMPADEPAPAGREEERKPSAIDLGITAAHSKESRPFGAQYVAPTAKYPTSEQGFYSGLQKVVDEKMPAKASPQQILSIVNNPQNAKADEVKWSNLEGFLEGKKSVTKQEVLDYLKNEGAVKFEEVVNQEKPVEGFPNQTISPKYSQYVLPGGDNYREVVLTMPSGEARGLTPQEKEEQSRTFDQGFNGDQAAAARNAELTRKERGGYTSSHFTGTPNYVAHMRLDERKDASGKDGLFIEEIQSDRHQQGREKGYAEEIKLELNVRPKDNSGLMAWQMQGQYEVVDQLGVVRGIGDTEELAMQDAKRMLARDTSVTRGIPDAPFRKDWPVQMFKRALRNAIDSGKEWIGWTSGDTQAERFDLSKQVDQLHFWQDGVSSSGEPIWGIQAKKGQTVEVEDSFLQSKLPDVVGKEIANRIITREGDAADHDKEVRTLSGNDLKIGGEGMKGFYDQILPKEIGKYVKKWGAKVEEGVLPKNPQTTEKDSDLLRNLGEDVPDSPIVGNETKIWKVEITPEMRESIQKGGQIQFMPSRAGEEAPKETLTENAKSITRQYGKYPKGTKVVVVGQRSKDPLDTNIPVQFPDGKVEKFPISWLKSDSAQGQSGNLKKLVKDQGRDAVNILLGEWDQNTVLNPDGTGIISTVDPRESMKKTKVPTSDFIEWLKGQDIEAILAEQGEEPAGEKPNDNRRNAGIRFMPYSPELPKTEDGKVDWEGFKTRTQETAKPLAGLS
jgi:hypothetical protein